MLRNDLRCRGAESWRNNVEDNQNYGQPGGQPSYGDNQFNNQPPYGNNQPGGQQPYGGGQQYNQQPYGGGQQYNQQSYGGGQQPYGPAQQYNQQIYNQPARAVVYDAMPDNHKGVAVASLVCGIFGILFFWFPFADVIINIAGLVCAIITMSKKYDGKGIAIGGMVCSIIGLLLSLYFMLCFFLGLLILS